MIALILSDNQNMHKKAAYMFDVFFNIIGVFYYTSNENLINTKKHSVLVYYGAKLSKKVQRYIELGGIVIWIKKYFNKNNYVDNSKEFLFVYNKRFDFSIIKKNKGYLLKLDRDIIFLSYHFLFNHDNIPDSIKFSIGHKAYFPLSKYAQVLYHLILAAHMKKGIPLLRKMPWPRSKKFALCLAHDVDWLHNHKLGYFEIIGQLRRTIRKIVAIGFKNTIIEFLYLLLWVFKREDIVKEIFETIRLEDGNNFTSTFFIYGNKKPLAKSVYFTGEKSYSTSQTSVILRTLYQKNREIGLHGSYFSYLSSKMLYDEKLVLKEIAGTKIRGIRQHCQNFDYPLTWKTQRVAGFEYDNTLMSTGLCFPFKAYIDPILRKNLIEIPLSIMDEALTKYQIPSTLEREREKFIDGVKSIIDEIERYCGVVTILWHPFNKYRGCLKAYNEILRYLRKKDPYIATCSGVADWWRRRESTSVVDVENCIKETIWTIKANEKINDLCFELINSGENVSVNGIKNTEISRIDNKAHIQMSKLNPGDIITVRAQRRF